MVFRVLVNVKEHAETEMLEMAIAVVAAHLARVKLVHAASVPTFVVLHVVLVVSQPVVATVEIHAVVIAMPYAMAVAQEYVKHLQMVHHHLHPVVAVIVTAEAAAVVTVVVDVVRCVKVTVPAHLA